MIIVLPLREIPGYGFPIELAAELTCDEPRIWFTLHLKIEHDGEAWPQLVEETRRRKPDWVRNPAGKVIAWRPMPAGEDIRLPIQRTIMPMLIAACAVPLDNPRLSQLGRHYATVRPQLRRIRRRSNLSDARLVEIAQQYMDAWADPTLNENQRRDYVARQLGYERSDTTIRKAIAKLKRTRQVEKPSYQLPLTAARIRYRIRPGTVNQRTFGGDPLTVIEAGHDYEETDWETIRLIVAFPEIEYEILEHRRL